MAAAMFHRGPVEDGYLLERTLGLGMRRLSIIDIEGGHQPLYNEDSSVAVILNGQIYNYIELRADLQRRGHQFRTHSDTEVIVHLYEELGERLLDRLNGMFAFALWDFKNERLLLARDRLGVKPLYYYEDDRRLAFASELKALLQCEFVPRNIDRQALADYLTYLYVPGSRTPLEKIFKLPPGHYLTHDRDGASKIVQYWTLAGHTIPNAFSRPQIMDQVHALLRDSVRLRLRSDVPVGAFLSGGLDSSTLVAYAAEYCSKPLRTFAVRFEGDDVDELAFARSVAGVFGTEHHEMTVSADDAIEHLPQLVWFLDEPNGDSAIVPSYLVSEFAARELRVVLSGLGGDELFGGYARYFDGSPMEHRYRQLPEGFRQRIASLAPVLPGKVARRLRWNALSYDARYVAALANFSPAECGGLVGEKHGAFDANDVLAAYSDADPVNRLLFFDMQTYLPGDVLHITDRMSMAVSLEARTPFLDYRLVEFCAGVPGEYKVMQSERAWKIALKDAAAPLLPAAIIGRTKKGFNAPVLAWVVKLLPVVRNLFASSEAVRQGVLNRAAVDNLLRTAPRTRSEAQRIWQLLILEIWSRVFLGRNAGAKPTFALRDLAS